MYGYDNDIEYMPANEGIGDTIKSWGKKALDFIKKCGKQLLEWMSILKTKISNLFKYKKLSEDEIKDASSKAPIIIKAIEEKVTKLLKSCMNNVYDLQIAYDKATRAGFEREIKQEYAKTNKVHLDVTLKADKLRHYSDPHISGNSDKQRKYINGDKSTRNIYGGTNGMDKLYEKQNKLNHDDVLAYNIEKLIQEKNFEKNSQDAIALKNHLNALDNMPLSYNALKAGYHTFKNLFSINQQFGTSWSEIIMMHDWATGKIKTYLQDVINLYKTGINATNALGRRLTHLYVANDEGKIVLNPMDKDAKYTKEKKLNVNSARNHYNKNRWSYQGKTNREFENLFSDMDDFLKKTGDDLKKHQEDLHKYDAKENSSYNDELDTVLEDAYDDGYVQALLDMGVDSDEIAEETTFLGENPYMTLAKIRKDPDAARRVERGYEVYKRKYRELHKDKHPSYDDKRLYKPYRG